METSSLEEKRIENLRKRLETLATRIPVIMLQRVEETFPLLKNSLTLELRPDDIQKTLEDQLHSSCGVISVMSHIKIEGRKDKQNKDSRQSNSYNGTDYNYNYNYNDCSDDREHEGGRQIHSCKFCHTVFLEKIYLQKHLSNFSKKQWLKCRKCKVKIFCTKHDLIKHRLACGETDYNDCNDNRERQSDRQAYSCRFCHMVFLEKIYLQKHLFNFSKKQWLKCRKCKMKIFCTKHDLIKHRHMCKETDYGDRQVHSCRFCRTVFLKKIYLQTHLLNFSKKQWLKCRNCKVKIYCTRHDLIKHWLTCKEENFKCDVCNKTFRQRSCLQKHLHVHSEERFTCGICNKSLSWNYFKEHYRKHTREPKCNICKENFHTKHELRLHKFLHNGGPFSCNICRKTFSHKLTLRNHVRIHSEKYFVCRSCYKSFNTESDLHSHRAVHKVKYVTCDTCNKSVSHKLIKSHKLVHAGKLVSCEVCRKTFSNQKGLQKHQHIHTDRSFMCDVCNKTFNRKDHLAQHCRVHTSDPIKCEVCNRVYESWCGLNAHRRIHTGELFPCNICKKTFSSKYDLKLDLIFHRDGGFKCEECGKVYTNRHSLGIHKRIHSGDLLTCHMCMKNFMNKSGLRRHVKNVHNKH